MTAIGALGLIALLGYEIDIHLNESILQRNLRVTLAGAQIAIDYKYVGGHDGNWH